MPEGDSIRNLSDYLAKLVAGRELKSAELHHQPLQNFVQQGGTGPLTEVFSFGKHLFLAKGSWALRTHLGMHGSWHRYGPQSPWQKPHWQASAHLDFGTLHLVCFQAKETQLVDLHGAQHTTFLRRLGPDLLSHELDRESIRARLEQQGSETQLCDLLLDQGVAAGLGNVYKSELLFLAGLNPAQQLSQVPLNELLELYDCAREALKSNLHAGRRRTKALEPRRGPNYPFDRYLNQAGLQPSGSTAKPATESSGLWVYHRGGEACSLCQTKIQSAGMGHHNRITYWCPRCQPLRSRPDSNGYWSTR